LSIDWVIRLIACDRGARVFAKNDRAIRVVFSLRMQMPKFVNARERHLDISVVHHRGALKIPDREHFTFKVQRPPTEPSKAKIEVAVNGTRVDDGG
jgi:hypothetical protein